jgi:hypothetical protein
MSRAQLLNTAVSFAHLQGIGKPLNGKPRGDGPDDDKKKDDDDAKKQGADESDDDYAKRMEEDDDDKKDDKASGKKADTDDDDDEENMEGDDDEPGDDDKKDDKSKAAHRRGVRSERSRWAAVLGHKSFAGNPVLGARLLATTAMSAKAIIGCLRDSPAPVVAHSGRSAGNPNLGPSGGTSSPGGAAAIDQRWGAAFKRAGVIK